MVSAIETTTPYKLESMSSISTQRYERGKTHYVPRKRDISSETQVRLTVSKLTQTQIDRTEKATERVKIFVPV